MSEESQLRLQRAFYIFGDSASLKILFELERSGERNFSQLRDELGINPATLSKKLKVLSEAGVIVSDKSHDRLRVYYSIHMHARPLRRFLDALERLSHEI